MNETRVEVPLDEQICTNSSHIDFVRRQLHEEQRRINGLFRDVVHLKADRTNLLARVEELESLRAKGVFCSECGKRGK